MSGRYYVFPAGRVAALGPDTPFPALDTALVEPNGLLAIGGKITADSLLRAYRQGVFPWFNRDDGTDAADEIIMWWSPDPRMVLFPDELKISRSLAKRLRREDYEVRFDTDFSGVIHACANTGRPDQDGTWISDSIIDGYSELHRRGYAHSAETWMDGKLVGGLYGVLIGRMFYGESMFHHVSDASKLAFVHMVQHLRSQGVGLIDCQMQTSHLASLGAREIPRREFAQRLAELVNLPSSRPVMPP